MSRQTLERFTCDHCGKVVEVVLEPGHSCGKLPVGWWSVEQERPYREPTLFCCLVCLMVLGHRELNP